MASEIVTDLRKPIDSDAIYDWIVEKRKTSTSDFPRLGFANEMGLIDEQRTTAADRITELEAAVERFKNLAKQNNNLAKMYKAQADEFRVKYVAAVGGPD